MKKAYIVIFLLLLVPIISTAQDVTRFDVMWMDGLNGWLFNWEFTYDDPLEGDGFILTNYSGQIVCRWIGTPEANCDCEVVWNPNAGWGACIFPNDGLEMMLFRLPENPLTCVAVLRWEEGGYAYERARYEGKCSIGTFLPIIFNNAKQTRKE